MISVDTKKKELVGQYKNGGKEWRPQGQPEEVKVHDFVDDELGRANPYGVYDLGSNSAWVSVGTDHDTASFAVATIRRWWLVMGQAAYPNAKELMITADGGGSNGSRVRLWKLELQQLADELAALLLDFLFCRTGRRGKRQFEMDLRTFHADVRDHPKTVNIYVQVRVDYPGEFRLHLFWRHDALFLACKHGFS